MVATQQQWTGSVRFLSTDRTGTNGLPETTVEWTGTIGPAEPNPHGAHVGNGSYTYFNYDNYLCPTNLVSQTTTVAPVLYLGEEDERLLVYAGAGGDSAVTVSACGETRTWDIYAPLTTPASGLGCPLALGPITVDEDGNYRVDSVVTATCYDGEITETVEVHLVGGRAPCTGGLTLSDVVAGPGVSVPSYGPATLAGFRNDDTMCRALWLPDANFGFVPQGIALAGQRAYISGYRGSGKRERCSVYRIDLVTGAKLAFTKWGQSDEPVCKHGGGIALTRRGLWLADTKRLFLLDPRRIGGRPPIVRSWKLRGLKGSYVVDGVADQIGVGQYDNGRIHWYRYSSLLERPWKKTLVPQGADLSRGSDLRAVRTSPTPSKTQGAAYGPGGLSYASSTATCGRLFIGGDRLGFGAGIEEIAYAGTDYLWAVFESGAKRYQSRDEPAPFMPMLASFKVDRLRAGDTRACTP